MISFDERGRDLSHVGDSNNKRDGGISAVHTFVSIKCLIVTQI